MIRINLLGQVRPKAAGKGVPVEATARLMFIVVAVVLAIVFLGITYLHQTHELDAVNRQIQDLTNEQQRLQRVKDQVEQFERQKSVLQQRINVIETLQKNRAGGQVLLTMVANTVVRTETLWLTSLTRKGNSLDIQGQAGSINAVANFITQLKRSGYFDKVEIKEAKESDLVKSAQTFSFVMTADIASSQVPQGASAPAGAAVKARS